MKILYDHQSFALQEFGGISRYFTELMNQFQSRQDLSVSFELSLKYSNNKDLEKYRFTHFHNFIKDFSFPGKPTILNQINKSNSISSVRRKNFDVFHPTYYDPYFLQHIKKKPFVLTIFDMIHEIFPQYYPRYDRIRLFKEKLANRANKIIAISQNTKNDLINIYHLDSEKIQVIYLGNPLQEIKCNQIEQESNIKDIYGEYLLFVGNRNIYKNFLFFIQAVSPLFYNYTELRVICAGGGKLSDNEKKILRKMNIANRVLQVAVNDQELKRLYMGAKAFVFPSLYEGFGLPTLEAFSCRCPVLLSDISSLPEIGGKAALYFDPYNEESIRRAIKSVLDHENTRQKMIDEGTRQLKKFSWEKTAEETKALYQSVCT